MLTTRGIIQSVSLSGSPGVGFTALLYVWNKVQYYQVFKDKTPAFRVGQKKISAAKTYSNPIKIALKYQETLALGQADSQVDVSRKLGVSRAKVTQMLNLLNLDEEIREFVLNLDRTDARLQDITERRLRPLTQLAVDEQRKRFWELIGQTKSSSASTGEK